MTTVSGVQIIMRLNVKQFILEDGAPVLSTLAIVETTGSERVRLPCGLRMEFNQENLSQRKRGPHDRLCNEPGRRILRQDPTGD